MNEKLTSPYNNFENQDLEIELSKLRESKVIGVRLDDAEMVLKCLVREIELLYHLGKDDEARTFLDTFPDLINLNQPHVREQLADTFTMVDDVEFFYNWYKQNLLSREANEGDQILIYGLLCHNRINEARQIFEKTFTALASNKHFFYSLKHIPKLI